MLMKNRSIKNLSIKSYKKNKLEQLKDFCSVAETGSISATAKLLNVAESSISTHISSFERDLGVTLFDKVGRNLKLNKHGEEYYKKARDVINKIEDIYDEQVILKINKIDILQIKIIGLYRDKVLFLSKFLRKMVVKIKLKHLILAILIICIVLFILFSNHNDSNKIEKAILITKGIAKNINDQDILMTKNLEANLKIFVERTRQNPNMSLEQLIKLKDELGVSILTFWDKNGKMFLNTNGTHLKNGEDYEKFKNYSIFDKEQCPDFRNLQSTPSLIRALPLYYSNVRKIPNKLSITWDNKTQRYLNISYDGQPIKDIIDDNKKINHGISYIAFSDPSGKIISDSGTKPNGLIITKYNDYNDKPYVYKIGNFSVVRLMFGGLQKEICYQINRGNVNDNNEYFYILTVVFKK